MVLYIDGILIDLRFALPYFQGVSGYKLEKTLIAAFRAGFVHQNP